MRSAAPITSWSRIPLGHVAAINPRLNGRPAADSIVSFVPMSALSATNAKIEQEEFRPFDEVSKGYTAFQKDDLLVAKITPCFQNNKIGQANISHRLGFGSTEFHVVRAKPGEADPRYLMHFLRQDYIRSEGERRMTGSAGQRRVPEDFLSSLEVLLPPLPEQRRIAAILDQVDALRAKRRAALAQLDEMAQAIFVEMFGAVRSSTPRWRTMPCRDVCSRISVGVVIKPAPYYRPNGVPAIRGTNIKRYGIDTNDLVYFSNEDSNGALAKSRLATGDLIIVRTGQPGLSAIVPKSLNGANAIDVIIATPKPEIVNPVFMRELINSRDGRQMILEASRGQIQQHFNVGSLANAELVMPPISLQQSFAKRINAVEMLRGQEVSSLAETGVLFSSLQHRAFTGAL